MLHRIRLHGPWEWHIVSASDASEPVAGRTRMPCDWRLCIGERAATARFERRFNRPTNLDADESVHIVFSGIRGAGQIRINGHGLTRFDESISTIHVAVTDRLEPTNRLDVELTLDPEASHDPGGIWGEIAIEIRSPD